MDWIGITKNVSEVYTEMAGHMESLDNIDWSRLERESSVCYPSFATDLPGEEIIFFSGFPTTSGKATIVPTDLLPPDELPDEEYPLVLTTGRVLEHWHTGAMTRRSNTLDNIEPEAIVNMNRLDMKDLKLEPGNKVQVKTRRGSIELSVRQDTELPKGMIFIPFCSQKRPQTSLLILNLIHLEKYLNLNIVQLI